MDFRDRLEHYDESHCWQYDLRLKNLKEDKNILFLGNVENLTVDDFKFKPLTTKEEKEAAKKFIERHEWLGTIAMYTTHYFGAYYKHILSGVVLMGVPNAFSNILGEGSDQLERLISRGACISWSPKNLASALVMWSIRWMVDNTDFRVFTAYSDPTAKELGTIYQACNFYYLGNSFGTTTRYISPYTGKIISDRTFRARSYYKKYAKELGIKWQDNWNDDSSMLWENIPDEYEKALRKRSKETQANSEVVNFPSKHKYAYVLGRDKRETRKLRKKFESLNPTFDYPKKRGE